MNKLNILILLLLFVNLSNAQWIETSFPENQNVRSLKYTSEQRVWGVGEDENYTLNLITSNDGGMTYQTKSLGGLFQYNNVSSFEPINDNVCVIVGDVAMYRTTDGGNTWNYMTTPDSIYKGSVELIAFDELNYCLYTSRLSDGFNEIYTSSDAGATWDKVDSTSIQNYEPVNTNYPLDFRVMTRFESTAYCNYGFTRMIRTNDKGHTWIIEGSSIFDMQAIGELDLFGTVMQLSPNSTIIKKSTNGGLTWKDTEQPPLTFSFFTYVKPKNPNGLGLVIVAGSGGAYYTTDTGNTWNFLDVESHSLLSFYNSKSGLSYYWNNSTNKAKVLKFDVFTSINETFNDTKSNVQVYPNPATDYLNIVNAKNTSYQITDMYGKEVKSTMQGNRIDISELSKGIYFLIILEDKQSSMVKFIKQ